jgi:hypothetical protein
VTWTTTPTFTFSSNIPGSTFRCSVDGGPYVPCSSPFTTPTLKGIGGHFIQVAAVSPSGAVDVTPARRSFELRQVETHSFTCENRGFKGRPGTGYNGCTFEPAGRACSQLFPKCSSITPPCPVGARCTYRVEASFVDDDLGIVHWIGAAAQTSIDPGNHSGIALTRDSSRVIATAGCQTDHETGRCSETSSVTVIGDGRAPYFICASIGIIARDPNRMGPDDARVQRCTFRMSIEAAATLVTTTSGGTDVSTYVPGAGTVTATAGRSSGRATAAAKKRTPLFKPVKKSVKKAGPVKLRLALSKGARATLRKKRRLTVTLVLTFKPRSGKTTKRTIKLTLRPRPAVVRPPKPKT